MFVSCGVHNLVKMRVGVGAFRSKLMDEGIFGFNLSCLTLL